MRAAALPHPVARAVDWEAATREALALLSAYLRIDTAQPAGRTDEAAAFLAEPLRTEGVETRLYETSVDGKVNLLARLPAGRPTAGSIVLANHMDVVPAVAEDWTIDPFGGEVRGEHIYGRGALDMKGMGVMELMAMLLVARAGVELDRDLILLCTCDEEVPSALGTKWMVDRHLEELDPACVLDEGGSGVRDLLAPGDVFEVAVAEKAGLPVRLIARAAAGHGSQPWEGAATHRLVRAAHALLAEPAEVRECPPVSELVRRLGGEPARERLAADPATRPLFSDTIALTQLEGGYAANLIPERAEMTFDCRLLPDTDPAAFLERLRRLIDDPAVEIEARRGARTSGTAEWDTQMFAAIEQACLARVPGALVTPSLSIGGTDAHFFRDRGIPAYGLIPGMFGPDDLARIHGSDERISIANLRLGTQIILDLALRLTAPQGR